MKLMRKTALLGFVAVLSLIGVGKANAQAGGSSVPFLLISPDARASGMGETGTAVADDINSIYWNPGGLGFLDYFKNADGETDPSLPYRQVALSFSPWLPQFNADLFYSYGTIGQHFDAIDGTVALNFIFMNLGEFTRTLESGDVLGKFISNEFSFGISYGTMVAPDLGVGFQLRYIQSNLTPTSVGQQDAGTGISAGFDLGVLWKPKNLPYLKDYVNLGLNLQNVGPKMTYINESDPLPTNLRLGTAVKLVKDEYNDLKLACDVSKLLVKRDVIRDSSGKVTKSDSDPLPLSLVTGWQNAGAEFSVGMEYWYDNVVALRAGYFTEPSSLGDRKFWNFGAGVRYDIFKLDFSFINTVEANHPLANTMRFSFLVDWK